MIANPSSISGVSDQASKALRSCGSGLLSSVKSCLFPPAYAFVSIRNLGEFRAATERTSASFSLCLLQPFYEDYYYSSTIYGERPRGIFAALESLKV